MFQGLRGTISGRRLRRRIDAAQPPEVTSTAPAPTPAAKLNAQIAMCDICCEITHEPLVQPCQQCLNSYCTNCISTLFKKAIRERSMMPPTCCGMIPLHVGLPHMSETDAEAYRDKFNEIVMFKEGFYCANNECSRFISGASVDEAQRKPGVSDAIASSPKNIASKHDSVFSNTDKPAEVSCTSCGAVSCVSCQALAHPGSECQHGHNDEQELDAQLSAWGYKRCPKCRNGVRRMFGCSHMQCGWCAFHFCWYCMTSFNDCETNGCDGQSEETPYDEDGYTDDDAEAPPPEAEEGTGEPAQQTVPAIEATSGSPAGPDAQDVQQTAENDALLHELANDDLLMGADPQVGHSDLEMLQDPATPSQTDDQGTNHQIRSILIARARRLVQRLRASRPETTGVESLQDMLVRLQAEQQENGTTTANQREHPQPAPSTSVELHEADAQPTNSAVGERADRQANLDGRSPGHWMESGLDFGEEPGGTRFSVASCEHNFIRRECTITTLTPWKEMQCHRCWKDIRPKIRNPKSTLASADGGTNSDEDSGDEEDEVVDKESKASASGKMRLVAGLSLSRRARAPKAMNCKWCGLMACEQCAERMEGKSEDQD